MTLDLFQFGSMLAAMAAELEDGKRQEDAMERACRLVERSAKSAIGTYKFGWTPLAPSTLSTKSADTPLLETGEMRDSIHHTVTREELGQIIGYVGSDNDKAVWHELGTSKIPPRSFLMEGAIHVEKEVVETLEASALPEEWEILRRVWHTIRQAKEDIEDMMDDTDE